MIISVPIKISSKEVELYNWNSFDVYEMWFIYYDIMWMQSYFEELKILTHKLFHLRFFDWGHFSQLLPLQPHKKKSKGAIKWEDMTSELDHWAINIFFFLWIRIMLDNILNYTKIKIISKHRSQIDRTCLFPRGSLDIH